MSSALALATKSLSAYSLSDMKAIALLLVILATHASSQTDQGQSITFHVTSVEQGEATDYCTTGKCSATRITLGGYRVEDGVTIEYILDCVEVIANEPKPHMTSQCIHVHAHGEYPAKLYSEAIFFDTEKQTNPPPDPPILFGYQIRSEKEVRKK
jgi:hypothetical protein